MMRPQYKNTNKREKGAALITVLISVMLITIILFEFQYSSMIERKLAYNDLNQTQAYYLAKSGVNFGLLRLALFGRLAANSQLKAQAKSMGGNIEPFLEQIWQIPLPAFPPTKSSVSQLTKVDRDAAEKVLQQTQIADGQYTHSITSESAKINLNALVVPKQNLDERPNFLVPPRRPDQFTAQMLFNLLERLLRDSDSPYEEYPDLRPDEQVMDIMDWVNPGDNRFFGGSKDSFYTRQDPPYRAKKNKFYTVEELRMVRGVTDHLFNKLRPHVTVYSEGSKINLNTASKTTYRVLYPDFTDDDVTRILRQRDEIGGWTSEAQFVDYVSNELGRSAFKTFYPTPADYPFTVGSESFFIESIGKIDRSASSIQRVIRVAVAMSGGVAGAIVQGVTNANNCNRNQNNFWDRRSNVCRTKPKNESDCQNGWGGTWMKQGQADVCKVNTDASSGGGPMMVPPLQTSGAKVSPNALRILYWAEV